MNRIVELSGLIGVKDEKVFAYLSIEPEKVRKALEIEIACTGADDNGAYNIYFDDEENICCDSGTEWQKEKAIEALSSVLEDWVHGGDADCIIAEFEEKLK